MLGLQSYTSYIYSYVPSWESTTSLNHVIIISWTIGHKMMITVPRKGSFNKSTTSRITNVGPKPSRRWSENDWSDLIFQSFWWSNWKRSLITTLTKSDQHFPNLKSFIILQLCRLLSLQSNERDITNIGRHMYFKIKHWTPCLIVPLLI